MFKIQNKTELYDQLIKILNDDKEIKKALYLTKSDFAKLLYEEFNEFTLNTALKYLLRMSYRSTPRGALAAVGLLERSSNTNLFETNLIKFEYFQELIQNSFNG